MKSLLPLPLMEVLKWAVPVASAALVMLACFVERRQLSRGRVIVLASLVIVSLFSLVDYTAWHVRVGNYFNYYEHYHYYIGTKYADEVGYTHMYAASVVAEQELRRKNLAKRVRDLDSGRHINADRVRKNAERVKERFTPERWEEFKDDIKFFSGRVSTGQFHRQLMDKGYNASPVWTMVSGTLANAAPTSSKWGMQLLALLDVFLLLGTLALVAHTFGLRSALLVFLMLTTHYVTSHSHLKAAFLRTDWICCLVASICFLKKGWFKTAGALTAYTALARIFPAIFLFGLGAKLLHTLIRERRIDRRYLAYFLSFTVTVMALVLASLLVTSPAYWREFIEKIAQHNGAITAWRIGFKYVFLLSWDGKAPGGVRPLDFLDQFAWLWWSLQLAVLGLSYWVVRRLPAWKAQAYGFVLMFFLVAPTYYYYIVLLVPTLLLSTRLEDPRRAATLAYLFCTSIVLNALHLEWGRSYAQFFTASVLMFVLVLRLILLAWRDTKAQARGAAVPVP